MKQAQFRTWIYGERAALLERLRLHEPYAARLNEKRGRGLTDFTDEQMSFAEVRLKRIDRKIASLERADASSATVSV
jgi:hypothetical protein